MAELIRRIPSLVRLSLFAFALTVVTGGVWAALVTINLRTTRVVPWALVPMAVLLWAMWRYLTGAWGRRDAAAARRRLARATAVPRGVFLTAMVAGALSLAALSGLWLVLSQLVRIPGNSLQDLPGDPVTTVIPLLAMASLVSASVEEIGFRGYMQGPLESRVGAMAAVALMTVVIAPAHASTQGRLWPVVVFYLLADAMLGCLAHLTRSTLPGVVVHAVGLFVFFTLIWPGDRSRHMLTAGGANAWFWVHAGLILLAIPAIWAFLQLAGLTAKYRQVNQLAAGE
jgi:membrane protease YdiL (CAAX protease family)